MASRKRQRPVEPQSLARARTGCDILNKARLFTLERNNRMQIRGHLHDGVVVLERDPGLPNGT